MKKLFSGLLAAILLLASALSGCSGSEAAGKASDSDKISIVATIFPEYDWVKNVLGTHESETELTLLLDQGVDLHSFQPTAADIMKISDCDLFIYVGGESDEWVEKALQGAVNEDMKAVNLMEILGDSAKEEEHREGMQEEPHEGEEPHGDSEELDEHVWLSLRNAKLFVSAIADMLSEIDEKNAEDYRKNRDAYIEKLEALDRAYQEAVSSAGSDTLLFADRFPFRYLVDDYGLNYYAAFSGCSAESEASFATVTFLAEKLDELSLPAVLVIEGSDRGLAETVIGSSTVKDRKILTLDSMQGTTAEDIKNGISYLSVMEANLTVLKEALQ